MIRLVATDLDGTLLRSTPQVSPFTVDVLRRVQDTGAHVVPVTARAPWSTVPLASELGLCGLAVCNSGATLYDLGAKEVIDQRPLDHARALELATALRAALPGIAFAAWRADDLFAREHAYVEGITAPYAHLIGDVHEWLVAPVLKLILKHPEANLDEMLRVTRAIAGEHAHASTTGGTFVELAAVGASKLAGLERICARLNVTADEVVACGDWPNDIPMLRWARLGVAPSNAHPDVVAAANEVCEPNDEDGVARTLERLLKEGEFG